MNTWRLKLLSFATTLAFGLLGGGCSSPQEPAVCQLDLPQSERDDEDAADDDGDDDDDDEDESRVVRPIRPEEWLRFLVRAGEGQSADTECSGQEIELPEPSRPCREAAEGADEDGPPRGIAQDRSIQVPLTDDSVFDRRITSSKRLIWVVTHEFSNGDGLGPIGLVERVVPDDEDEPEQLRVHAIGTLRARSERVRLRLITLRSRAVFRVEGRVCAEDYPGEEAGDGDRDTWEEENCERVRQLVTIEGVRCRNRLRPETCQVSRELRRNAEDMGLVCTDDERADSCTYPQQVLIAEGEFCVATPDIEDDEEEEICHRAAHFMFRDDDRFVQTELHHMGGTCLGHASMDYSNREEVELPGSWRRDFSLISSYEIRGNEIVIYEQVEATDTFTGVPEVPSRPYRTAESVIHWYPVDDHFMATRERLWEPMLELAGSMQLPPHPDPE